MRGLVTSNPLTVTLSDLMINPRVLQVPFHSTISGLVIVTCSLYVPDWTETTLPETVVDAFSTFWIDWPGLTIVVAASALLGIRKSVTRISTIVSLDIMLV